MKRKGPLKILVFLGLMLVAAVSRDVVNRRWRIPEDLLDVPMPVAPLRATLVAADGPGPGSGSVGTLEIEESDEEAGYPEGYVLSEPTAERRLRRSLLIEVLMSVVILAVTALLVNAAPARELDTGPYLATLTTKQVVFDVTITPAKRGANEMHLFTLTPSGSTTDPTEVSAEMSQKSNDIAPIAVKLIRLAPGHYTSAGFTVPFSGDWQLTVKAVINSVDEASATATVPIHS